MISDADIIAEVKSWIGTPWKHGVARKGWGTDCGQFIVAMCRGFGWVAPGFTVSPYHADYSMHNNKSLMREALINSGAVELADKQDLQVGDILLFQNGKCEAHTGMAVSKTYFVHSNVFTGVITDPLHRWADRHISSWRLRHE
jgi:cell wall-associated NlpC family hydrolase